MQSLSKANCGAAQKQRHGEDECRARKREDLAHRAEKERSRQVEEKLALYFMSKKTLIYQCNVF